MVKASFLSRFAAFVIDNFAMGLLALGIAMLIGIPAGWLSNRDSGVLSFLGGSLMFLLSGILLIFQFLYFGYYWSKSGQSVGMKLVGIKVVDEKGGLLSFLNAGLRGTVGYWLSGLFFSLGFIWAAIDAEKQGWHDKLFRTHVVNAKSG